jgi:hypothetical protein
MKNPNSATPIAISPCLASLGSNPMILITIKPKLHITNVLGGGCSSKWLIKFKDGDYVVHFDSNNFP